MVALWIFPEMISAAKAPTPTPIPDIMMVMYVEMNLSSLNTSLDSFHPT